MSKPEYLASDNRVNVEKLLGFLHEWYINGGSKIHGDTLATEDETFADLVMKATFGRGSSHDPANHCSPENAERTFPSCSVCMASCTHHPSLCLMHQPK